MINGLRDTVQQAINARREALAAAALDARLTAERVDVTLPVTRGARDARAHPPDQPGHRRIDRIFADMGFSRIKRTAPDIETDYLNFTALNFPEGHPAREMHDTFFMQPRRDRRAEGVAHPYPARSRSAP